uniref:Putative clock n=1 Tax=Corethrella appendiculata TaxID=1370023 RepID=U5EHU6_9DIPT
MDDDPDDKDDTKRKSRNLSEKKRRDQFNLLINELSSMVSSNNRKMDKSTVLKSTIAFLKSHNEIAVRSRAHEIQEEWKPSFLSNEEFTHLILEAVDGFIIVFSSTGRIFYASESITSLLGHLPNDLLNMTVYDMIYEDDQTDLYNILLNPTVIVDSSQTGINRENQISFTCHIKRGSVDYSQQVSYDLVQFTGYFRRNVEIDALLPSTRYSGYSGEADTRLIFVGTGRLVIPQLIREMSIIDSSKSEFTSRHSLEWKFLFLDHRAPPIIGYLPFEVLGTSGYDYYHFDDLEKVVVCHEALMQKGEGTSCYYRFLTKGQQWIWLQTRFYITYHQWNSKPEFVVCTHRVVSYADVVKQFKRNNGLDKDVEESESNIESDREKKLQTSASLLAISPWSSKGSRASRFVPTPVASPSQSSNRGRHRYNTYHGPDSDSATSMSAESLASRQSVMTQHSTKSRMRNNTHSSRNMIHHQQQSSVHYSQHQILQNQQQTQSINEMTSQVFNSHLHSGSHHSQSLHPHQASQQRRPSPIPVFPQPVQQIIAPATFIEPPQQYLTAIPVPVQPVAAFPAAAAVLSPLPPSSSSYSNSNMVLTPSQNHVQEQLQRKHEELQYLIVQQQEELRRVQEQLLMARYNILPSIVNVPPYSTASVSSSNNSPYHQPLSQHPHHHQQSQLQSIHPHSMHSQDHQHHSMLALSSGDETSTQQQQQRHRNDVQDGGGGESVDEGGGSSVAGDEMISYMQLAPVPTSQLQQQHQHLIDQQQQSQNSEQQQMLMQPSNNENNSNNTNSNNNTSQNSGNFNNMEILQYQMAQEQAQILFSSNMDQSSSNNT